MAKRMKLPNPLIGLVRPGGERYIKTDVEKQREIKERRECRSVKTAKK